MISPYPLETESGSLQNALLCFVTAEDRGVFVKTVFSAIETFDSAPVERMRGRCHLFVKRCLQLVRMSPEEARIQSVPMFSPQSHHLRVVMHRRGKVETFKYCRQTLIRGASGHDFNSAMIHTTMLGLAPDEPPTSKLLGR
jgi:hypothetical protein